MPKREDEYWAGMKEPKGRGLCPRCGSSNISYNKVFQSWRCNKCESSFPTPSYGPEGESPTGSEYARHSKRSLRIHFPMKKAFLIFLLIACLVFIGWAGFLLYNDKVTTLEGAIIIAAGTAILLWNMAVLRKRRLGAGTIVSIFLVIALLGASVSAFAGVEPFSKAKDEVAGFFNKLNVTRIATVERIWVGHSVSATGFYVHVELKPNKSIRPYFQYNIKLYENGVFRDATKVFWSQPEINVQKSKTVSFPVSNAEGNAYQYEDISHIFSVEIPELN